MVCPNTGEGADSRLGKIAARKANPYPSARRDLTPAGNVRSTSAKWAWVEYVLAQGGAAEGLATLEAAREGGSFAAYRRAFAKLEARGKERPRRSLAIAAV